MDIINNALADALFRPVFPTLRLWNWFPNAPQTERHREVRTEYIP